MKAILLRLLLCVHSESSFLDTLQFVSSMQQSNVNIILDTQTVLELRCTVSTKGCFEWEWQHNGVRLNNGGRVTLQDGNWTQSSSLEVHDFTPEAAGNYTCRVRRQVGQRWSEYQYTVVIHETGNW